MQAWGLRPLDDYFCLDLEDMKTWLVNWFKHTPNSFNLSFCIIYFHCFVICCSNADESQFKWLMRSITSNFSWLQTERDPIKSKVQQKSLQKPLCKWLKCKKMQKKSVTETNRLTHVSGLISYQWHNWGVAFGMITALEKLFALF